MQIFFSIPIRILSIFLRIGFCVLGNDLFLLKRQYKFGPPWRWLGWFGVLHGLNEWADMVNLIIIYQDWYAIFSVIVVDCIFWLFAGIRQARF